MEWLGEEKSPDTSKDTLVFLFVVNLILITVYTLVMCTVSIETYNFNFPYVCALSLVKLKYKSDGLL